MFEFEDGAVYEFADPKTGEPRQSTLSDAEVAEKLALDHAQSSFAMSLAGKVQRWSERQRMWAHKLVLDAERRERPTAEGFDGSKIVAMFVAAGAELKWPKITMETTEGSVVALRLVRKGRNAGCVNVSNGEKRWSSTNVWYGRLRPEGQWELNGDVAPDVLALLEAMSADPMTVAMEYGMRSGNCCFCTKGLTTEKSTVLGYGPVCARRYGLPHDQSAMRRAAELRAKRMQEAS